MGFKEKAFCSFKRKNLFLFKRTTPFSFFKKAKSIALAVRGRTEVCRFATQQNHQGFDEKKKRLYFCLGKECFPFYLKAKKCLLFFLKGKQVFSFSKAKHFLFLKDSLKGCHARALDTSKKWAGTAETTGSEGVPANACNQ